MTFNIGDLVFDPKQDFPATGKIVAVHGEKVDVEWQHDFSVEENIPVTDLDHDVNNHWYDQ